jgi:hypothetical protein
MTKAHHARMSCPAHAKEHRVTSLRQPLQKRLACRDFLAIRQALG